ncbi:MAG: formate dehydrogenase accessory sulfurtransferase FdhD [Sphingomonadaceae bacterium]|nr:formate dehydrogenase accessory sulfurtransferase FdhD [Sphingomonadaceae bacterium]
MAGSARSRFIRIAADGARQEIDRIVPIERPIAVEINGIGYAVMMATPVELTDFAYGFLRSERLIENADEVIDVAAFEAMDGVMLRITLAPEGAEVVIGRVRHRTSESSCGLCGIENLEQAMRALPRLPESDSPADAAIFAALEAIRAHQPLNAATGAVHAAALCDSAGAIRLAREDVGRHNAFDKLIGAMLRAGLGWDGGFALLSARCSYELVEKAALAGCPTLVTISAPTSLALERAREAGLRVIVLARTDAVLLAEPSAGPPTRSP